MLLKAVLFAAMTMSPDGSAPESPVVDQAVVSTAPATEVKRCESLASFETSEAPSATSTTSNCTQAQAHYDAMYEIYYYALINTQAASHTYNQCMANGWGDCSFWYENMIMWSNQLGEAEVDLMYASVELMYWCGET